MPVLEAMTVGVPVVAADRGALPEVLGDAGVLVSIPTIPTSSPPRSRGCSTTRRSPALRGETGRSRARAFSWRATPAA